MTLSGSFYVIMILMNEMKKANRMKNPTEDTPIGNLSEIEIEGNTVLRNLRPYSPSVHRLLLHLNTKGIDFVPRFLGVSGDCERISFMPGQVAADYPLSRTPSQQEIAIRAAAKMLRALHDASADFKESANDVWFLSYPGDLPREVICHNDFAPYNITFKNKMPVGLIDFDTACPAPRIWDIAYAVYRFIPLGRETFDPGANRYRPYDSKDAAIRKRLLYAFVDAYGGVDAAAVLQQVPLRLQALVDLFDVQCQKGDPAFIRMKQEGHQLLYRDEIAFVRAHANEWI